MDNSNTTTTEKPNRHAMEQQAAANILRKITGGVEEDMQPLAMAYLALQKGMLLARINAVLSPEGMEEIKKAIDHYKAQQAQPKDAAFNQ